jgi:hypothetical protein
MGLFDFLRRNKINEVHKHETEKPSVANSKEQGLPTAQQDSVDEFTQQMITEADECVEHFSVRFGKLDYSVESLKIVDEILAEASDFVDEMEEDAVRGITQSLGTYIFEVARRNFGGKYYWYDKLQQPILVTGQPHFEISILAIEKVKGRLKNGPEDNIPFYFKGYIERVTNAKTGDKALIV